MSIQSNQDDYEKDNHLENNRKIDGKERKSRYYLEGSLEVSSVDDIYKAISPRSASEENFKEHNIHFLPTDKREDFSDIANLPLTNVKVQTRVYASQDDVAMSELR